MLANFFSIGKRTYLNNAVVVSDAISRITHIFGYVTNFRIQFRKPFLSQGEFEISTHKLDGNFIGHFDKNGTTFYFAYIPTGIPLDNKEVIENEATALSIFYGMSNLCRDSIALMYKNSYGAMSADDIVISVILEIPDTSVLYNTPCNTVPRIRISHLEETDDKKYKASVYLNDEFFGYRYSTVKALVI